MSKFTTVFSCWRVSTDAYLVIAGCEETQDVQLYTVSVDGSVFVYPSDGPFPDLRMFRVFRWDHLPGKQRAHIRGVFLHRLEDLYGPEPAAESLGSWGMG